MNGTVQTPNAATTHLEQEMSPATASNSTSSGVE
jgi:hypothetical protein